MLQVTVVGPEAVGVAAPGSRLFPKRSRNTQKHLSVILPFPEFRVRAAAGETCTNPERQPRRGRRS